jgi:hypothetical protein
LVSVLSCAFLATSSASASWLELTRADASFDLREARRLALASVAADATDAEAVAAAGWWLQQINNLPDPEEILIKSRQHRDPELGFVLARIASELDGRPPSGTIATAEITGPFGVFENLDLERGVMPPDAGLPAPETLFEQFWKPHRLSITTRNGVISPPEVLAARGVFVGLWTIELDQPVDGWLVVEAAGSHELSVDGRAVTGGRDCGRRDPEVTWLRVRLDAGRHGFRADMAGQGRPEVRISLFDNRGQPAPVRVAATPYAGPWAASEVSLENPPATAALERGLDGDDDVERLLLAASVREYRGDPVGWRRWLELAATARPDDPWPRLALAWYWMTAPILDDAEAIRRRAREHLRATADIPMSLMLERGLALRERRSEDHDRLLETLVERHIEDVRVLRLWVLEAERRGWIREAEDGLQRLRAALPGSRNAAFIELQVLEGMERWQERQVLLRALAATEPFDLGLVEELANGCLVADAVAVIQRLRERIQDPDLDVESIRLHFSAGDMESALRELAALRARWGAVRTADELELALTAGDRPANDRALETALRGWPSAIELLSLAWRRGRTPFFEPFRLSVDDVTARMDELAGDVDAVLLLDQAVEKIFSDGSSLYYYHGITRAITPVGARQASRLQQLPNAHRLKVRVHKPDGSIEVPPQIGNGGSVIELEDVEPGDLVEEEYVARVAATGASRRGHLPPYVYRFADPERAFGLSEYILLVPPEIELLVEGNFDGLEHAEWEADGQRVISWRAESVAPIPEERFAPPISELLPWVSYAFGASWQDVGDALRDRLLPLLVLTPELEEWSRPLLDTDTAQAVDNLVNAVIDDVEPGRGVLDFGNPAGSSFSRRSGNRLGIVAAALLASGWEVDLVMGRTRPFAGTHLLAPTFDAFVLPLLRIERRGDELWLDLEEERRGIGRIDPILQGSDGLLIPLSRPQEPVRIVPELPSFPNPDLEEAVAVSAVVQSSGDARITIALDIRGPQAERVMEQILSVPIERVPMVYQRMAVNFVANAVDVDGSVARVPDGVRLEMTMNAPNACRGDGDEMVCRSLVFGKPLVPVLAALPTRRFPLVMPVPVLQRSELTIELPEGWSMDSRPRRIETRWGSVVETIDRTGRKVRSVLRLELPAQTVQPEEYAEFARFCHAADELSSRPPVISRTTATTYTPAP